MANAGAAGAARADAIDFTGGPNNSLQLGAPGAVGVTYTQGTLDGGIGVGGTLSVDPGTAAGAAPITLANLIHDYVGTGGTVKGSLVKAGAGTLTLTGANTYSGGTSVTAGQLTAGSVAALGANTNTVAVSGGTLDLGAFNVTQNGGLTLTGGSIQNGTLSSSGGFGLQAGTVSAALTGAGAATKTGMGTVLLSNANSYAGTALNGGTLELGQLSSAGTGAITFGVGAQTLRLDVNGTLGASVRGFAGGDIINLAALNPYGATASYGGTTLTVRNAAGQTVDTLATDAAPSGFEYRVVADTTNRGGSDVVLAAIPVPTISAPANGTDTNDNTPTISGSGEAGDRISLTLNGQPVLTPKAIVVDGSGQWAYTPSQPLADGNYSVTATESSPSGTGQSAPSNTEAFTVDTTPPTVSSPTDTVAQNSGPAPIGIAAPSDNLTAAGSLAIAAGALPTDGTVALANGQAVRTGEALTSGQLTGLLFTPTPGLSDQGSTFTYTVTDGAGNATTGTAALNIGSPSAPTIAGTHATADQAEAPVQPFTSVTVTDPSGAAGATETLSIALTGQGGALVDGSSYAGPRTLAGGGTAYQLTGTAAQVTAELDALSFIPTSGGPGTTTSTTFVLTDRSSAGTSVVDSGTSVSDTAAAAPAPSPAPVAPDAVSFSPQVTYRDGVFTLSGTASSAAGVNAVEITAQVDGVATDLGAATVGANGAFTFSDRVGPHVQGFITATLNGGTASTQADYSLQGGEAGPYKAEQDRYNADGSATTAVDRFKADGSQRAALMGGGQTFTSASFDTFDNGGQPSSTFVFDPGTGKSVVNLFRVDGTDHDFLSFKGSDFSNSIATVLNSARNTATGLLITDPTASSPGPGGHDKVLLTGIKKDQLTANPGDIQFHA